MESFCNGPELSFGFVMADNGLDYWAANFRGCRFSRKHRSLEIDQDEFWQGLTFEHRNYYDIPAFVEKVAEVTQKRMAVVSNSMSCINMIQCLSEPKIRQQITPHIFGQHLVAPGFLFKHTKSYFPQMLTWFVEEMEHNEHLYGPLGNKNWDKQSILREVKQVNPQKLKKKEATQQNFFNTGPGCVNWSHYHHREALDPSYRSYVSWKQWLQFYHD